MKSLFADHKKIFTILAMGMSFLVTGEACITKAVANSVFLTSCGADMQPFAWLLSIPFNLLLVTCYNRFLFSWGCAKMHGITVAAGILFNILSAWALPLYPHFSFILYIWKDIFIMLMFQQLWALLHATLDFSRAKYLYGWIFAAGGIGSMIASLIPWLFAVRYGSVHLLYTTIPYLAILFGLYLAALSRREKIEGLAPLMHESQGELGGVALIRKSPFLKFILAIVASMQIIATLLDFNFSSMIESAYPDTDLRTAFFGRYFGIVHFINLFLQFVGSFFFLRLFGIYRSHLFVPALFILLFSMLFCLPTLPMMLIAFAGVKTMDYSFFALIKEILYIPLSIEEKFKAKAIIDIFVYRSSKTVASLLILFGLAFTPWPVFETVLFLALTLALLWLFVVFFYFRKIHDLLPEKVHTS